VVAGVGISVEGSGRASDPYVIEATGGLDISSAIRFIDSATVDFTVTGEGTSDDPWTVTADASTTVEDLEDVTCADPAPGDVLQYNGTGWVCAPVSVEAGAIFTAAPITGSGAASDPLTLELVTAPPLSGDGTLTSPLTLDPTQVLPAGMVMMWAPNAAPPPGWLLCNGADLERSAYPTLFAAIGTTYGGAGTTFNVPDFNNRYPKGTSGAPGTKGGSNTTTLSTSNLPAHTHAGPNHRHRWTHEHYMSIQYMTDTGRGGDGIRVTDISNTTGGGGTSTSPTTNTPVGEDVTDYASGTTGSTGGGTSFSNEPAYTQIRYIIKT
jgi:microcystin-dependent protein